MDCTEDKLPTIVCGFVLQCSKTASGRICKVTFFGLGNFDKFLHGN